jgi:hypothetical protein
MAAKHRDTEKSEVQGPARGHEREETRGQETTGSGDSGKKASGGDMPVETTSIDVIEEPAPAVVAVTGH